MKKAVSILSACMFLVTSAYAAEKITVANAAGAQAQPKALVAKQKVARKASEKSAPADYALESFGCCGLPQ